jgi:hypothetical protein
MSYVGGFVWRNNVGNHANLTKELGKIMWLGTNRASKWKTTFERNGGWESQEETNLQIPMQNEHVCAKTTAKPYCHFHTKHIFLVRVAKFEHGEMPKSTNNPGAIVRVWPCRCLWSTGAAFQTRQKKPPDSWKPVPNSTFHFTLTSFLMELRRSNFDMNNRHVQPNRFLNVDFLRRASMII